MIEQEETKFAVNTILISTHGEVILQERDNKPGELLIRVCGVYLVVH